MHFEPLFFLLWALQCLGRWGNNENPVDPNSTQGTLLWPPVHHSSAAGSSVGPCTGASPPPLTGSPRSDLYDTDDMCEFDTNEYIWCHCPGLSRSQGAWIESDSGSGHMWGLRWTLPRKPGLRGIRFSFSWSELPACLTLTPDPPVGKGRGQSWQTHGVPDCPSPRSGLFSTDIKIFF